MDLERGSIRISGMDLQAADPSYSRQRMATRWRDERALVRGAQGGSEAALDELFRLHWRRAHQAAYLVVHDAAAAEDIAQEAFLAAIRNLDRFDRRRPFAPWLHRIVVNRAIDHARARTLRAETDLQPSLAAPAAAPERPGGGAPRRDRPAAPGSARRDRPSPPARVHAGRDRDDAERPARHRQLPAAARPRRAAGGGS